MIQKYLLGLHFLLCWYFPSEKLLSACLFKPIWNCSCKVHEHFINKPGPTSMNTSDKGIWLMAICFHTVVLISLMTPSLISVRKRYYSYYNEILIKLVVILSIEGTYTRFETKILFLFLMYQMIYLYIFNNWPKC